MCFWKSSCFQKNTLIRIRGCLNLLGRWWPWLRQRKVYQWRYQVRRCFRQRREHQIWQGQRSTRARFFWLLGSCLRWGRAWIVRFSRPWWRSCILRKINRKLILAKFIILTDSEFSGFNNKVKLGVDVLFGGFCFSVH